MTACKKDETALLDQEIPIDNYFGTKVADPYRWMEDIESERVKKWIQAQNETTFAYLEEIPYRPKIEERLTKVWNYERFSAPFKRADKYFYYRNDGLQNQSVLYMANSWEEEGDVLIDPNTLSEDGTTSLSAFSVSQNGKYAVYGTSKAGSDWVTLHVMDLEKKEKMPDTIEWVKFSSASWKGDGFYYGRFEKPEEDKKLSSQNENKQIYYHKLGTKQSEDTLIFADPEHPKRSIYTYSSKDERFLIYYLTEGATTDNALYVQKLAQPDTPIKKIIPHFDHSYDVVAVIEDMLYLITNEGAKHKRLIAIDFNHPEKANWKEIIPEKPEILDNVSYVGGRFFASYLKDASSKVYAYSTEGKKLGEVKLPGIGTVSGISGDREEKTAFFAFTSYTYPTSIFKLNTETLTSSLHKQPKVDFDPEAYEVKQVFYSSKDNTKVPMFIVHKKGIKLDGTNPTLLYGYGGFSVNLQPYFSASRLILLENEGVLAIANLRGGGEYGENWHKAGMLLNKQNVFDDFIAAAEYLINEKYTSPEKLAIQGGSNGGLLVGAVMCQHPELFKVALPAVGVMDMLRYHKFTIGHAWIVEYGSSDDSTHFQNLYSYSPLHNLKEGTAYPATLVLTGDHDDRVVPAHSYKFFATLAEKHKGKNPVFIRIDTQAGHGAGKPIAKIIEEQADIWAFLFYNTESPILY